MSPSTRLARRLRLTPLEDRSVPSAYGQLPIAFEANVGQAASQTDFLARGPGYALALGPTGAAVGLRHADGGDVLHVSLIGANPAATAAGSDELMTKTNYLLGNDPTQWRTDVPNFGKVTYHGVYPGIDLVYYGNQRQLEYDFVVAPGSDPRAIHLSVAGAQRVSLDARGNLVLQTAGGNVVQHAPVLYQEVGGVRRPVAGRFVLNGTEVGFRVGRYDPTRPLVIDPVLSYSTYLGGNGEDQATGVAVDAGGNAYVTGFTYSANFATTTGAVQPGYGGNEDVFVTKLNATGTQAVYSTYLGGSSTDEARGIAVDAAGNAYLAGVSESNNFPTTAGAFQTAFPIGGFQAFVAQLNPTGSGLVYSTYLGGDDGYFAQARGIAVDAAGNAYVVGDTGSGNFPTRNPVQPAHADGPAGFTSGYLDAFLTKLNPAGSDLVYSTYLGGTGDDYGYGIAVDASGSAYLTGQAYTTNTAFGLTPFPTTAGSFQPANASTGGAPFVTKVDPSGSALVYSTFLGGTSGQDYGRAVAVDAAGDAFVTGGAQSTDFPVTPGAFQTTYRGQIDAFVAELNPAGSGLAYATFLGGTGTDQPEAIAVDGAGSAVVTGLTESANFPTASPIQPTLGGSYDAFVTKVNPAGSALLVSTFLGGTDLEDGQGIALDAAGNAYVAGTADSANFPTTPGVIQPTAPGTTDDDAFVAKLDLTPPAFIVSINDVAVTEGNTGTRSATFTVTRTGDTSIAFSVPYATANGTATAGSDYTAAAGTLTFAAGETSKTIAVTVRGDRVAEADETFVVNLGQPTAGGVGRGQGVGTIQDDEPRVSITDVSKAEGRDGTTTVFTFTVSLSMAYDQAVTMTFKTANGTATTANKDYVAAGGTLTFAAGETQKTITIVVNGDSKREADETFFVDLTGLSTNAVFTKSRGVGTILNDD